MANATETDSMIVQPNVPAEVRRIWVAGDDAVSLINEAISRFEQGKPGVVTYLLLARGRLKDNGLTTPGDKP